MSGQTWVETLVLSTEDGPTIDGTLGYESTVLPASAMIELPPNHFQVGTATRLTASGRISCDAATPGTLTLWMYGFFNDERTEVALNAAGKTDVAWSLVIDMVCRSTGATGTFQSQGIFTSEAVVGSPLPSDGGCGSLLLPSLTTFNSAQSLSPDLLVVLSATTATTAITCTQYKIESLN